MSFRPLPLLALILSAACAAAAQASRPNFLIILSDDQGYDDLSSHGNKFAETPRLDRLAAQSLEFTRFYVEPACAPTRASLLTGRSFVRTGVWSVHFGGDYLALDETTFANRLGAAGYVTGLYGKWHNGKTPGYLPADRGFQEVAIAELYSHKNNAYRIDDSPRVLADVEPYRKKLSPQFAADRLAADAIAFLRRNKSNSFCLYLPHIAMHSPWEAPPELMAKYKKKGCSDRFAALCGLLEQMDTAIGKVLDEVDTLGLAENTVVLFFSDNGMVHNTVGPYAGKLTDAEAAARNVSNLRGTKGTMYEGGIRSPLMVRWPGKIRPGKTDTIAHVTDLFPTLMDFAGIPTPAGTKPLDGRSLSPILLGQPDPQADRVIVGAALGIPTPARAKAVQIRRGLDLEADAASTTFPQARLYARSQQFKLVKSGFNSELFDMAADPSETKNVSDQHPEEARRLTAHLKAWYADVKARDHPYQSPISQIGRVGAPGGIIHFNSARRLTGDFTGKGEWAHSLTASQPGSEARFSVRVVTPGRYRAVLEADVKEAGHRGIVKCSSGNTTADLTIGSSHELGAIEIPADATELTFILEGSAAAHASPVNFWNITLLALKN